MLSSRGPRHVRSLVAFLSALSTTEEKPPTHDCVRISSCFVGVLKEEALAMSAARQSQHSGDYSREPPVEARKICLLPAESVVLDMVVSGKP